MNHIWIDWRTSTWTMLASIEHSSQFHFHSITMMRTLKRRTRHYSNFHLETYIAATRSQTTISLRSICSPNNLHIILMSQHANHVFFWLGWKRSIICWFTWWKAKHNNLLDLLFWSHAGIQEFSATQIKLLDFVTKNHTKKEVKKYQKINFVKDQ